MKMPKERPDDMWLGKVSSTQHSFSEHIGNDLRAYVKSVCTKFMASKNVDNLADHTTVLSKFQGQLYDYQNEILNVLGTGPAWSKANSVIQDVLRALRWVEEIYCTALVDPDEVCSEYDKGTFLFQTEEI